MKKMLYILNIANRVNNFSYTSMKAAQELGFDYHIAGNWKYANDQERIEDEKKYGIHIYQIDFVRTPYHPGNIKAYKQLKEIVEKEKFDVIHCNTPIGGVVGRLLGKTCKVPTVIYQAHGFHFYKGAPALNWLIYYPIEKWLAHKTDALITINQEDYQRAQAFKLRGNGKVYYVPGVGIDIEKYKPRDEVRNQKRAELGVSEDDIVVISAGDLIERKNYSASIKAIAGTVNETVHYFICGEGPQREQLEKLSAESGADKRIHFLGYRTDMKELLQASDIFLFTTLQEGLPRSMMEAMASGLPCIASNIRGNTDLLIDGKNGFLVAPDDIETISRRIDQLSNDSELRRAMSLANIQRMHEFDTDAATDALHEVYQAELGGVDYSEYLPTWARKRFELGIPLDAVLLISVGDLNVNKNNKIVIEALKDINDPTIHYILCGEGELLDDLKVCAESVENQVHFLGYRTDVMELMDTADIFVMPSLREGLSRSLMEAMASGLPCIVSKIRGNADLLEQDGGNLASPQVKTEWIEAIKAQAGNAALRNMYGKRNLESINQFALPAVVQKIKEVYIDALERKV